MAYQRSAIAPHLLIIAEKCQAFYHNSISFVVVDDSGVGDDNEDHWRKLHSIMERTMDTQVTESISEAIDKLFCCYFFRLIFFFDPLVRSVGGFDGQRGDSKLGNKRNTFECNY